MPDLPTHLTVSSVQDIMGAARIAYETFEINDTWWRGQARDEDQWPLVPAAHRGDRVYSDEAKKIRRFRHRAPTRTTSLPAQGDVVSWLFLAQHYRLATRLLDWTELPLVATFFAVNDANHDRHAGVLYALDPGRLNEQTTGQRGILPPTRGDVFPLFQRPFDEGIPESDRVVAVVATEVDPRMMVQRSCFTIHGGDCLTGG